MTWQPIDTAPKDGTKVLLVDGSKVVVGYWGDAEYDRKARCYNKGWTVGGPHRWLDATHWMVIPALPND